MVGPIRELALQHGAKESDMALRALYSVAIALLVGVAPVCGGNVPVEPGTVLASFAVSAPLNDVRLFPLGEIVAVGNLEALHVDELGQSRISQPRGEDGKRRIGFALGVWGAAPDNVWAVTSRGNVLHWDGST